MNAATACPRCGRAAKLDSASHWDGTTDICTSCWRSELQLMAHAAANRENAVTIIDPVRGEYLWVDPPE